MWDSHSFFFLIIFSNLILRYDVLIETYPGARWKFFITPPKSVDIFSKNWIIILISINMDDNVCSPRFSTMSVKEQKLVK